jgi:hypothetical protein
MQISEVKCRDLLGIEDKWVALLHRLCIGSALLKGVLVSAFSVKLGLTCLGLCFSPTKNNSAKS